VLLGIHTVCLFALAVCICLLLMCVTLQAHSSLLIKRELCNQVLAFFNINGIFYYAIRLAILLVT
jgi:hypothetical protein